MGEQSFKTRIKTAPCPVCDQHTLQGHIHDLTTDKINYTRFFLPEPVESLKKEKFAVVDSFTPFDLYLCPNDLYVYSGMIQVTDAPEGAKYSFDDNVFYRMKKYFKPRTETMIGSRVEFMITALKENGYKLSGLSPSDDAIPDAAKARQYMDLLVGFCDSGRDDPDYVYDVFSKMKERTGWNPFALIPSRILQSRGILLATLELQLADLLYLHRRESMRNRKPFRYKELASALDQFEEAAQGGSMDDDLAGNLLIQCLKIIDVSAGRKGFDYLSAAHHLSEFLVRIKSRPGYNINRKLEVLAVNADVTIYLNLALAKEIGRVGEYDASRLRILKKRLSMVGDYSIPGATEESARIVRIGRYLRKFTEALG